MPQQNHSIITPMTSGALDNPNAPQSSIAVPPNFSLNPDDSTMPPSAIMERNIKQLDQSEYYKTAPADQKLKINAAFYRKYVLPVYKASKTPVSDDTFKQWMKQRADNWQMAVAPEEYNKRHTSPITIFSEGVASGLLKTAEAFDNAKVKFQKLTADLSLGAALLDSTIRPHMGPIIMSPDYEKAQKNDTLEQFLKADEHFAEHNIRKTTANKILRGGGQLTSQIPAFIATDGVLGELGVPELLNLDKATGLSKIAGKSVYNAAQGYLVGAVSGDDPAKSARDFGVGTLLIEPPLMFLGKLFGWGGGKLISALSSDLISKVADKAPETVVSNVSVALAGNQKQKISAATIKALNDLTGGNFAKSPEAVQKVALTKLASIAPELADQIGFIDKTITGVEAASQLIKQREVVPELNNVLNKLEQRSKQATHVTVADAIKLREEAELLKQEPSKAVEHLYRDEAIDPDTGRMIKPGGASAKSLEFGDNLTKHADAQLTKMGLGPDRLKFETRGHKLLFYLNVLMTDNQKLGPTKERNREFELLVRKLQEYFPGDAGRLPELIKKSDKIWNDIEQASKAGLMKEGEVFRYWRNHSQPGESPLAHEVELLQQAQKADALTEQDKKLADMDAKLKAAFKPATEGKRDTNLLQTVMNEYYPGKKYGELTSQERTAVNQEAAKRAKAITEKRKEN